MNGTWWRSIKQLDEDQLAFVNLPREGKHLLEGPPGSGKTNLLLLRAQYMVGEGEKNVLILTYTRSLTNFIRTGITIPGLNPEKQIRTFHSWLYEFIQENLGNIEIPKWDAKDKTVRTQVLELFRKANARRASEHIYSAIFVDEAQDLSIDELEQLVCLSDKVCICGDIRQGIYQQDGLDTVEKLGLAKHSLTNHFRIGHEIAKVADRLIGPKAGERSLYDTCNYNAQEKGTSLAKLHECSSRDAQFAKMLTFLRVQLDAYNDEPIGVICASKDTRAELKQRFEKTDLFDLVSTHGVDADASFGGGKRIHILTVYSSKGTEFRAVHLFGMEELASFPFRRTKIAYTAVTRAKTALHAYRTGATSVAFENAFEKPKHFDPKSLFPGDA